MVVEALIPSCLTLQLAAWLRPGSAHPPLTFGDALQTDVGRESWPLPAPQGQRNGSRNGIFIHADTEEGGLDAASRCKAGWRSAAAPPSARPVMALLTQGEPSESSGDVGGPSD